MPRLRTPSSVLAVALATLCLPAAALGVEPNETEVTATGPVPPGALIEGALEVRGDIDYYFFYTSGPAQLTFTLSNISEDDEGCYFFDTDLFDTDGDQLGGFYMQTFGAERAFSYSAPEAAKFFLRVRNPSDCDPAGRTPSRYRIAITPGTALTGVPPGSPGPAPAPAPGPAPAPTPGTTPPPSSAPKPFLQYATRLSARRGSRGRIVGRLSSRESYCSAGEPLVLRRVGSGIRRFGRVTTRSDGSYAITMPRRRGRYYLVHARTQYNRPDSITRCGYSRSREISRR